jgi:hypothetical protein
VCRIEDRRLLYQNLSRIQIMRWANELAQEFEMDHFQASNGWLDKFLE